MSTQETTILVGKKPTTSYVIATVMSFNAGAKKVILKARGGGAIARAVSTAVMIRDRFLPNQVRISDIKLLTDKVTGQGGKERSVAAIEIVLERV
ncbi:DNA-binding protein Alba [Vulcanisaeta distributa]|uniref:DNA-binding protein Alba n=1 Tax=Vulcanisaeta distributa TaxID=164451 RepID=UPI0006D09EB1|nr:DNA-binding protein Alba [Vulcanisaeta distributa]